VTGWKRGHCVAGRRTGRRAEFFPLSNLCILSDFSHIMVLISYCTCLVSYVSHILSANNGKMEVKKVAELSFSHSNASKWMEVKM